MAVFLFRGVHTGETRRGWCGGVLPALFQFPLFLPGEREMERRGQKQCKMGRSLVNVCSDHMFRKAMSCVCPLGKN